MQKFFRRGEYVSVRSLVFVDTCGAHPNYGITNQNFLSTEHGLCSRCHLLGNDDSKALRLLDHCKKVLAAMFEGQEDFLRGDLEMRKSAWGLLSQFNCDALGLAINFSPYEVLPFAFGSHEIPAPWQFVEPLLQEDYKHLPDRLRG